MVIESLEGAWNNLKLEQITKIDAVELPTDEQLKVIRKKIDAGDAITETEQVQLAKSSLLKTFGEELISATVSELNGERLTGFAAMAHLNWNGELKKSAYKFFNCFRQDLNETIVRDLSGDAAQRYLGTRFPADIKASMIEVELIKRLGLKQFVDPNKKFVDSDCEGIHAALVEEFKAEKKHWIHKSKPAAAVAKLLRTCGLDFVTTANGKSPQKRDGADRKLVRYYQITEKSLEFLNAFSEHQLSKNPKTEFVIEENSQDILESTSDYLFSFDDLPDEPPVSQTLQAFSQAHSQADRVILEIQEKATVTDPEVENLSTAVVESPIKQLTLFFD